MSENTATNAIPLEEKMKKASTTLATMLDYLGLEATVKAEDRNGRIALVAVSEDAGRIIGRKGQTLDQLQLLVNRMVNKNDTESPRITIDVDGYSKKPHESHRRRDDERSGGEERHDSRRRKDDNGNRLDRNREERNEGEGDSVHDEMIRQQALDAAKEVKRWGEQVTLPQMNSHDRRIIHIALKEDTEIKTESSESEGGNFKSVVISLNKKDNPL